MKYDTVVGLEVHIQMNTLSKAFCGDGNSFGESPNTNISAISLAHPGTLPVANTVHVDKAIQLGLALGSKINKFNFFDRKHYFYPDLPKGYQITQDNEPICLKGSMEIEVNGEIKIVEIHHIHMEEDAGKNIHDQHDSLSLLDVNRAGTPLLELVTEPCLSSGEEVFAFMAELQKLLRYIDVSDADMEKGSMRCDCNVSIKPEGSTTLGERCEIKNLNSKRYAREAVKAEYNRQVALVKSGGTVINRTMQFDKENQLTLPMRDKEGVADYRYLPDPDLPPIVISYDHLAKIQNEMPELPWLVKKRLIAEVGLNEDYADQLTQSPRIVALFNRIENEVGNTKQVANFIVNQWLPIFGKEIKGLQIGEEKMISYLNLIKEGTISASIATQQLWPAMLEDTNAEPQTLAEKLGIVIQADDSGLETTIRTVLEENPDQVKQYKSGKKALFGFFIGAVMRVSGGSVDPKALKAKLTEILSEA
ncbi:MAG: aspartyl-tRNA(Asn)/glutamyl-tRNA(Gln) amidotransferase subunit B [Saprospiraceae bacterium]|jgi:aspartyl-tRNA(Asn)/glutamyl-tRNA(Gln) amidotransferase subunit B